MHLFSCLAPLPPRVIVQAALASPDPQTALRLALLAREMRHSLQAQPAIVKPRKSRAVSAIRSA